MEEKKVGPDGITYDSQGNPPIIDEHCFWEGEKQSSFKQFGHSWYWDKVNKTGDKGIALNLDDDSFVICETGPRGAGKTTKLTWHAEKCVYLYGSRIISNYPIKFNIRYETHGNSEITHHEAEMLDISKLLNMDEDYRKCIIVLAEAPQIINRLATMSWKNRLVNIFIQQLRHNESSLIYDSQNEKWVDGELQWQTDIVEYCRDASRRYPRAGYARGSMILYDMIDKSGLWTGYSYDERPRTAHSGTLLSQAIWGTFGTHYIHDVFQSLKGAHVNVDKYEVHAGQEIPEDEQIPESRRNLYRNAVNTVSSAFRAGKVEIKKMYQSMGEISKKEKDIVGAALHAAGTEFTGHGGNKLDFTNFDMAAFMSNLRI
jgi:hypothetical protein